MFLSCHDLLSSCGKKQTNPEVKLKNETLVPNKIHICPSSTAPHTHMVLDMTDVHTIREDSVHIEAVRRTGFIVSAAPHV